MCCEVSLLKFYYYWCYIVREGCFSSRGMYKGVNDVFHKAETSNRLRQDPGDDCKMHAYFVNQLSHILISIFLSWLLLWIKGILKSVPQKYKESYFNNIIKHLWEFDCKVSICNLKFFLLKLLRWCTGIWYCEQMSLCSVLKNRLCTDKMCVFRVH